MTTEQLAEGNRLKPQIDNVQQELDRWQRAISFSTTNINVKIQYTEKGSEDITRTMITAVATSWFDFETAKQSAIKNLLEELGRLQVEFNDI